MSSFHPDRPCQTIKEHVGRDSIIQYIYARLGTSNLQSSAVVGFYKEGKTSILNIIKDPESTQRFLGDQADQLRFLYIDLAKNDYINPNDFYKIFNQEIELILGLKSPIANELNKEMISEHLEREQLNLVLLLDNFNSIVINPGFPISFFEQLRSWLSHFARVGAVVTSPIQLLDLHMPIDLASSPFFNIFDSYSVLPLERREVEQLMKERLLPVFADKDTEIQHLLLEFGLNPYPLQVVGQTWMDMEKVEPKVPLSKVINAAHQKCIHYFETIFSSLSNRQLDTINELLDKKLKKHEFIDNSLFMRGLLTKGKQGVTVTSRQLEKYFRERMGLPMKKSFFDRLCGR